MKNFKKRVGKIEKLINNLEKHHGTFIINIENGHHYLHNDNENKFQSMSDLEKHIRNKYKADKFVFIIFDKDHFNKPAPNFQ